VLGDPALTNPTLSDGFDGFSSAYKKLPPVATNPSEVTHTAQLAPPWKAPLDQIYSLRTFSREKK
jgi:hypothetical protein